MAKFHSVAVDAPESAERSAFSGYSVDPNPLLKGSN